MALSSDLIAQFVKYTRDDVKRPTEKTVYGTAVISDEKIYVRLDGSELLTPVSTTADIKTGERVTVLIKDHSALITGNVSNPSASTESVEVLDGKVTAAEGEFRKLTADNAEFKTTTTDRLEANEGVISDLEADNLDVKNRLTSAEADIGYLEADNVEITGRLEAAEGHIGTLQADLAEIENLDSKYATIDFANIGLAAIEYFFSKSGLIENVVVGDGNVTGTLVGVTIKGDTIEGNTVVADKLVIKGEDGLYYKLNTDGVTTEAEQTEYNSLNGSIITAKSITAEKVNVHDIVAFGATIGGFNIVDDALYSGVKESVDNSTPGAFLGSDGQVAFGNAENYLKFYAIYAYYKVTYDSESSTYIRTDTTLDASVGDLVEGVTTEDGHKVYSIVADNGIVSYFCRVAVDYKLAISADSILFGSTTKYSLDDVKHLTDHVKVGTYEDAETGEVLPCVELSETDSDFKMRLTNKKAVFMDGINDSTSIDSDGVETENLRVKNDIRHYDYVWRRRSNGNLGLMWMEVTD